MARMPGAKWLGEHSPKTPMSHYDIVCIHTIVGWAPAHAAHFSVKRDGTILQSRDTKYRSAANLNGNPRVIAIENEDGGDWADPLTPAQVASNAKILAWAHKTHGVPLQLCPNSRPSSRGLAYHRQGIDGNFGGYRFPGRVPGGEVWSSSKGKVCPGDNKIAQRPEILRRAKELVNPPKPAPKPVTSHTRWATRTTGVYEAIGGKKLRDLAAGASFKVIDGSGSGKKGWVQTTHKNWVNGNDTTTKKPAAKPTLSVMSWNVENKGAADAVADVAELRKILAEHKPDVVCLQEAYRLDLAGIPGYREVYHAAKGYPVTSENRAQAILVRDGVAVKEKKPLAMLLSWVGPKVGAKHEPRVHRYVTVNKDRQNWRVSTWHVPFGAKPVEETRLALVSWMVQMGLLDPAIAVLDANALSKVMAAKVGKPATATVDGGGLDRAVFRGCRKVKGENLGKRGRSDHPVKIWTFEI